MAIRPALCPTADIRYGFFGLTKSAFLQNNNRKIAIIQWINTLHPQWVLGDE